jgi:hypothetical protein
VRRREVEIVLGRIVVAPRYESNIRASRRTGGCSRSARSRHRSSERPAPKCLLISSAEPTAEAAPDPAFALIDAKLLADIAHCAAIDVQDEAEPVSGFDSDAAWEASERCCDACTVVNEADWRLATTLTGVAAVLRFANEIEDGGMEWPATDTVGPEGWHYQLRATMAAAIEALIKARAGEAVQA